MKIASSLLLLLLTATALHGQPAAEPRVELIIRCDDIGMCHSVNMAAQQLLATGIPFSASVMFACPWYQEGVELLKAHPDVAVGVHLTLNAEWKNYRWGPVAGSGSVPSLVDSCGYFFPSRALFMAHAPRLDEVELELRAQIERAIHSGLRIDYVDYHMGTAVSTPELRAIVEKLAREYKLGISRYFGDVDAPSIYGVRVEDKSDSLVAILKRLEPGKLHLAVHHIGMVTPEMSALADLNSFGLKEMSRHRQGELQALCAKKTTKILRERRIRLRTYRDVIAEMGLERMQAPVESGY